MQDTSYPNPGHLGTQSLIEAISAPYKNLQCLLVLKALLVYLDRRCLYIHVFFHLRCHRTSIRYQRNFLLINHHMKYQTCITPIQIFHFLVIFSVVLFDIDIHLVHILLDSQIFQLQSASYVFLALDDLQILFHFAGAETQRFDRIRLVGHFDSQLPSI